MLSVWRGRPGLAEEPAGDVHLVDALVADVAVAVEVDPVPVVVDRAVLRVVAMRRHERRGAGPEVVVDRRRDRLRAGRLADAVAALVAEAARRGDLAEVARLHPLHRLAQPLAGADLRAGLHDAVVLLAPRSTSWRPSQTLWETGFSTYTSLPACIAQIAASECQWFGVAMVTASMSLLSSSSRMSV